ncbi:class I SAM-dependent methyltransferase [Chitinophaga arvensicola]|uniref:Methyltransferase domain-containing protein n=1 Tax=Chitinophaga arvensicola TaxID=29529 RepID=A0A1I0S9B2_9BACT|nr:class I SAM-dependent methyltransferase [Chitinophaga arvensicola]SEW52763.1 Methyltransferase domain-containing protein [Chitinophaga arvensicola]
MIEIFKTSIQDQHDTVKVVDALSSILPNAHLNFDLEDQDKVLRIQHPAIDTAAVITVVESLGFSCKVIPDKICTDTHNSAADMQAFWDASFNGHQTMWGFEPTQSAIIAKDLFVEKGIKDILVPGIGYGRNARVFVENGMQVTGIEISQTAIGLARKHYGHDMQIFHGSVTDMPFDNHLYEGIFCYGLVYLLNPEQRKKMIRDAYQQLQPGGWMVFSVVSRNSPNYGKGKEVGKHTFEIGKGGQLFFYDEDAVKQEFGDYGLTDFWEIDEQTNAVTNQPAFRFIVIKCKKA